VRGECIGYVTLVVLFPNQVRCNAAMMFGVHRSSRNFNTDYQEYMKLFGLVKPACPRCVVDAECLQEFAQDLERRDYNSYESLKRQLRETGNAKIIDTLHDNGVSINEVALAQLPSVDPGTLFKADLLHGLYLGLVKNVMKWTVKFMSKHRCLECFDKAWRSCSAYPGFSPFKKSYTQVMQ